MSDRTLHETLHDLVVNKQYEEALKILRNPAPSVDPVTFQALKDYALKITKTLTGLSGGGSEMFDGRIGDMFKADLLRCAERIRDRHAKAHELLIAEKKRAASSQARIAELEAALTDAADKLEGLSPDKLEGLSHIHDGNPSDALADIEPVEYARHMLGEARQMAREAHRDARAALANGGSNA